MKVVAKSYPFECSISIRIDLSRVDQVFRVMMRAPHWNFFLYFVVVNAQFGESLWLQERTVATSGLLLRFKFLSPVVTSVSPRVALLLVDA